MTSPPSALETGPTLSRVRREFAQLAVLCVAASVLFLLTRELAQANHASRQIDAATWYDRGMRDLSAGLSAPAVDSFRHAVALDESRADYHLALADALLRANRDGDAQTVLVGLRRTAPESADVNVRLARLSVRSGQRDEAIRYYEMALAALWPEAASAQRRAIRLELTEYMLRENLRSRALAALLILTADVPVAAPDRLRLGQLFLAAGDPRRAAERFSETLARTPDDPQALAGAGAAAFALRDYARARRFFDALPADTPGVDRPRQIVQLVLERDPLAPRLGPLARARRLRLSADDVIEELDACGARLTSDSPPETLVGARAALIPLSSQAPRGRTAAGTRDDVEEGLGLLLAGVRAMRLASCGAPTAIDEAVERVAASHELVEPS